MITSKKLLTGGGKLFGSCIVVFTLLLAGCEEPNPTSAPLFKVVNENALDLKEKFGITETGKQGVTDTFYAIHHYLASDEAKVSGSGINTKIGVIALEDYIDINISDSPANSLPVIVVGINSFNGKNDNGDAAHLVFQFKNSIGHAAMGVNNLSGYLGSDVRNDIIHYLEGETSSISSYNGVPLDVIWAPSRRAANKGSGATAAQTINDKIWLPTEWEIFGANPKSNTVYENTANQVQLQYYITPGNRIKKFNGSAVAWFLASPDSTSTLNFCAVSETGSASASAANTQKYIIPAFCVK